MAWIGIPRQHVQAGMKACVDRYVIRRTKEEVSVFNESLRLPPCIVENLMVKINAHEASLYAELFAKGQLAVQKAKSSVERWYVHNGNSRAVLEVSSVLSLS